MRKLSSHANDSVIVSPTDGNECQTCRLCGFLGHLQNLGELPEMYRFAGTTLDVPLAGGRLTRCPNCSSMQRNPIFPDATYDALYRKGTETVWAAAELRYDQQLAIAMVNSQSTIRSVLDVGCNTGTFLQALPAHIEKYGIEPSIAAAAVAREGGVNILADSINNISGDQLFDCITFIDVIEHIPYPTDVLRIAVQYLTKDGFIIVSSGNPGCKSWVEFFRNKFWYCSFAEHISFPSRDYFKIISNSVDLSLEEYKIFRYSHNSRIKSFIKLILQLLYFVSPRLNAAAIWLRFREFSNPFSKKNAFLPCAGVFTDHHIARLKKNTKKISVEF
jgi:SAM-dependent methyltransferase